ncbi:MAG: hypothetical protein JXA14_00435 [Anaerolineae bacterium]|nr:hypothetical protein [Anaerolineae bacterium]
MASRQRLVKRIKNLLNWPGRHRRLLLLLAVLLLLLTGEGLPPGLIDTQIKRAVSANRFDFVSWEAGSLWGKLLHGLIAPQRYMDEEARHDFVVDYMNLVSEIQRVEWEINLVYTNPDVSDPDAESAELRARLAELRTEQRVRQPIAEAILEEQIATALADVGFGTLGQEFPPVSAHFTPLPSLLVVSPRDRIENAFSLGLRHGLDTAQREAIEAQIDAELNVSSLITNIGGLAAYPSMLLESSWLPWVAEVTAHEWTHHYLTLRPLGWNYLESGETRTINETTASIVGKEIGYEVITRYYPELPPPELPSLPEPSEEEERQAETLPPEPPEFDFRLEMRETRIRVDELLADGKIEEAEAYMEERRQMFVAEGYVIRKLNQAYFAFYGSYADAPGAAGEDPIGPTVLRFRARSPDLYTFVSEIAHVTTLAELEALLAENE